MVVSELFETADIKLLANVMPNGEAWYRLMAKDGSGYIRTVAGPEGAWQNSHFHKGVLETYIVQTGWMAFAVQNEWRSQLAGEGYVGSVKVYLPGDVVTSQPEHAHNVYLPAGAEIHTVKHGVEVGNPDKNGSDWWPADEAFDAWTKSLKVSDIAQLSDTDESLLVIMS